MKVNQRHIDILEAARERIENKSDTFICYAINKSSDASDYRTVSECEELKEWISRQLNGFVEIIDLIEGIK